MVKGQLSDRIRFNYSGRGKLEASEAVDEMKDGNKMGLARAR